MTQYSLSLVNVVRQPVTLEKMDCDFAEALRYTSSQMGILTGFVALAESAHCDKGAEAWGTQLLSKSVGPPPSFPHEYFRSDRNAKNYTAEELSYRRLL